LRAPFPTYPFLPSASSQRTWVQPKAKKGGPNNTAIEFASRLNGFATQFFLGSGTVGAWMKVVLEQRTFKPRMPENLDLAAQKMAVSNDTDPQWGSLK